MLTKMLFTIPAVVRWSICMISMQYTNRTRRQPAVAAPVTKRNNENNERQSATPETVPPTPCGIENIRNTVNALLADTSLRWTPP